MRLCFCFLFIICCTEAFLNIKGPTLTLIIPLLYIKIKLKSRNNMEWDDTKVSHAWASFSSRNRGQGLPV